MNITKEYFTSHVKHEDYLAWFDETFPSGTADYQTLINHLAEHPDTLQIAQHLLRCIGTNKSVTKFTQSSPNEPIEQFVIDNCLLTGSLYSDSSVCVLGILHCNGSVLIKGNLTVHGDIIVSGDIKIHGDIKTVKGINVYKSNGNIYANSIRVKGDIFTAYKQSIVEAGYYKDCIDKHAGLVISKTKPHNLLEGVWYDNQTTPFD